MNPIQEQTPEEEFPRSSGYSGGMRADVTNKDQLMSPNRKEWNFDVLVPDSSVQKLSGRLF